jgi:hypothetical protein
MISKITVIILSVGYHLKNDGEFLSWFAWNGKPEIGGKLQAISNGDAEVVLDVVGI